MMDVVQSRRFASILAVVNVLARVKTVHSATPLAIDHGYERLCMACVQDNPLDLLDTSIASIQMYNFLQQECVSINNITNPSEQIKCPPMHRCCFGIECCVKDGCRSPTDTFYYESEVPGDIQQQCDECCDYVYYADSTETDSELLVTDSSEMYGYCDSVSTLNSTENPDASCQMFVSFDGVEADLLVKLSKDENDSSVAVISGTSIPASESELPWVQEMYVTSEGVYIQGLPSSNFGPSMTTCMLVQKYAMNQLDLLSASDTSTESESALSILPKFEETQTDGIECNTYGKSLLYYAAREWLNFTEVVVPPTIGTDGTFYYTDMVLMGSPSVLPLCQTRSFADRESFESTLVQAERGAQGGDDQTWYNKIVQQECFDVLSYPPSCPKCAMCTKHDELSTRQLVQTYNQVEENRYCTKNVCEDILGVELGFNTDSSPPYFVEDNVEVCSFEQEADSCECFCPRIQVLLARCPHVLEDFSSKPALEIVSSASSEAVSRDSDGTEVSAGVKSYLSAVSIMVKILLVTVFIFFD